MGWSPFDTTSENAVEDDEHLAHTRCKGQLLGLTCGTEALVERLNDRVESCRHQGAHVQGCSQSSSSTPDGALATKQTAVTVERCDANEACDLPAVQSAQLRKFRQEGHRECGANTGNAEQIVFLPPHGAVSKTITQITVQLGQALLQPEDMAPDLLVDRGTS